MIPVFAFRAVRNQPGASNVLRALGTAALVLAAMAFAPGAPGAENPAVLRDLTSLVGKAAPAFSLSDSEGEPHPIHPGDGKWHVLVFHMGSV